MIRLLPVRSEAWLVLVQVLLLMGAGEGQLALGWPRPKGQKSGPLVVRIEVWGGNPVPSERQPVLVPVPTQQGPWAYYYEDPIEYGGIDPNVRYATCCCCC